MKLFNIFKRKPKLVWIVFQHSGYTTQNIMGVYSTYDKCLKSLQNIVWKAEQSQLAAVGNGDVFLKPTWFFNDDSKTDVVVYVTMHNFSNSVFQIHKKLIF